jgi:DNA-binding MarR family transcriptional regulator
MNEYEYLKLNNQLCFSVYTASRAIIRSYKPLLEKIGLTYTQYITMLVLWERETILLRELTKLLYLDSGTLTPLLKKLENMKLIKRQRLSDDERNLLIEITEDGIKLKEEAKNIPQELLCNTDIENIDLISLKKELDNLIEKII